MFIIALLGTSVYILNTLKMREQSTNFTLNSLSQKVAKQSATLTKSLRAAEPVVEQVAIDIENGTLNIEDIDQRLKQDLADNLWMYGLGIAFEPYQAMNVSRLWSRNYNLGKDNQVRRFNIGYDYTQFEHEWYRKPLLEGKFWTEPYFSQADQELVAEYGVPFWLPGKNKDIDAPSGVVFGNLSIEKIKNLIQFDNEYIAYYHLLSRQGRFIIHPDKSHVLSGNTIFQYAWEREDPALNSMAVHLIGGESGQQRHLDPLTNTLSWMIYEPLEALSWSLVAVVDAARLSNQATERQQWFIVVGLVLTTIALLTLTICFRQYMPAERILAASVILSMFTFAGVVALWVITEKYPKQAENQELRVISSNVLNDFKNRHISEARENYRPLPKFIKTGVYLQSVEFEGANNVKVSGYVWQHYSKTTHKGIARGFILPESDSPEIEEVYRDILNPDDPGCQIEEALTRDCEELVGWYVSTTLRQAFDYSLFPLDSQQVWLRMWHQSFRENIMLVPFLDSYAFPNPKLAPGVQHGFVLPGWQVEESWFSLNNQTFSTNFGDRSINGLLHKPELYFNVNIQRQFLNPFVSRIIPVALISILMFLIVLISTKSSKVAEWLGFSASDVVLGLSALFFVVGVNHSELRQSLQSSNIMYFEYFYFVIYVMLLYVAVSSIYIAKHESLEEGDENFLTKILYWPTLSVVLFFITAYVFF